MNTIEDLNKKFKTIEDIIKNIHSDRIYKDFEANQKILYKNVLFKFNKKDVILQHIIKETKAINELQRRINTNYEKIKERNSLFKEILLKIDSCEENYKKISEILTLVNNNNFDNNINLFYKDLKEKIGRINKIFDDETKYLNIIDSLIINNKIKYLNNKVLKLKENINKSKDDVNNYVKYLKQLESIMNLEQLYNNVKNMIDMNEEKIEEYFSNENNNIKDLQNSKYTSIEALKERNKETIHNFNVNFINNIQYKNSLTDYCKNLSNEINIYLKNIENIYYVNNIGNLWVKKNIINKLY